MVHGPYREFVNMGVQWSINKKKSFAAIQAIVDLQSIIAEKDIQIKELNGKLFIVDEEILRYRFNMSQQSKQLNKYSLELERMKPWATIGKVGIVIVCVAAATFVAVLVIQTVNQ